MKVVTEGALLWEPSKAQIENSSITQFRNWVNQERGHSIQNPAELWKWSVDELEQFWESVWKYCKVKSHSPYEQVLESRTMPGAKWFSGATVNYAEHVFRNSREDRPALIFKSETVSNREVSWKELQEKTAMVRQYLISLGVTKGDRVVAYMPNIPETVIAFLACASMGVIWSVCSPDFGTGSVIDRFKQIEPTVLFAVDGYSYNGTIHNKLDSVGELQAELPTLTKTILFSYIQSENTIINDETVYWDDMLQENVELEFDAVPFDHPLWILFSSGTTGLPKPIVQGQGGIIIEHLKTLAVEQGIDQDDVFFWFTTTGWMMWNLLMAGLLTGGTVVLYDGSPAYPNMNVLWDFADEAGITFFGTSAAFLNICMKTGVRPNENNSFSKLKAVYSTGSPLSVEGFSWIYDHVKKDLWLVSASGGTDICAAFVGGCPVLPVYAGEIQARALGANVQAFNDAGQSVLDEVGELVITDPMPSMPLYFWNDQDDQRYLESYFEMFPGIWRHGDWIKIDEKGSSVIFGRSDSTINRQGVRLGTSEIYRVVESLDEVLEGLVVDLEYLGRKSNLSLFIALKPNSALSDSLKEKIKTEIKQKVSPRFVPNEIFEVKEVPKTFSGKKLEVPIRKILLGQPVEKVVNRGSVANPDSLNYFIELSKEINK